MIELPQTTLWVAAVFFHRFYMRRSMVEERGGIHHYVSDLVMSSAEPQHHVTRDGGGDLLSYVGAEKAKKLICISVLE